MPSQTLQTIIAINAQANGFGQVGATLTELGSMVNGLSQQLIDFGKESVDVYKNYEKSMHEAEVALSTSHGRNTKELADAMDMLNAKATEWAATTIFHTDDVANAINQAAHAGWDLNEILNGIPVAMQLAQSGSLDLSDALTYITKTMKAFDVPYDELGEFVDMWVYAANSSTGDVKDFGDAMQKLGATMRFTDSKEELFALIGLMHDMGESGSTAATLLRTSMMRIIAPSGVASKVMEELGATDEEIREIREDASKLAALQTLEDYGFNAFKDDDQAKPMIQIYAELGEVLAQIAGGYENITKNKTTLGILSTIFGTRGITGALDIVTALQNAVELRDKLIEGNAEGYGAYAADTMMDTLYGKSEIFESKIERLKQVVGEELSGQLQGVMEHVGGIVDRIAEMDDGKFSALVSGLEVIAGAGPALLLAGGAFRLIGTLLTPAGGFGLGLIALTAAATAIEKIQEANLKDTFGDMDMDKEGIMSYVKSLSADFQEAYKYTNQFQEALQKATSNYREASSTLGTNLFSLMIRNAKLTPDDLEGLLSLGQQMYEYAEQALFTAASGDSEYWTQLFGGDEESLNNPIYQSIIEKTNAAYEESVGELEAIGEGMKKAITKAFDNDQVLDPEEYNEILGWFRQYNELVARAAAEAQDEENRVKMRKWLLQAQTGSFDDVNELSKNITAERDTLLQQENDLYLDKLARLIENGGTREEQEAAKYQHQQRLDQIGSAYDDTILTMWDSQLSNNGQMENWEALRQVADTYLTGERSTQEALQDVYNLFGGSAYSGDGASWEKDNARAQLAKITGYMMQAMGGENAVANKINDYIASGNIEMANRLKQFYAMQQLANGFYDIKRTEPVDVFGLNLDFLGDYETWAGDRIYGNSTRGKSEFEKLFTYGQAYQDLMNQEAEVARLQSESDKYAKEIQDHRQWLDGEGGPLFYPDKDATQASLEAYEITKARIDAELAEAQAKAEQLKVEYETLLASGAMPKQETEEERTVTPIAAPQVGEGALDKWEQLVNQGVQVKYTGEGTELSALIENEDGLTLTEYIDGDATGLEAAIEDQDGKTITTIVDGNVEQLREAIQGLTQQTYYIRIRGQQLFADGGRATEPSIFGEVPGQAEWAIPEAHNDRTAGLLNAARAGSGFTWGELMARSGALNTNQQQTNKQTTIVFSPTINANDVTGVEEALEAERKRFEKWYEDKQMQDSLESYA